MANSTQVSDALSGLSMAPATIWLTISVAALITYLYRLSFLAFSDRLTLPAWVRRALRFVPAAVLSALVLPSVLYRQGQLQLPWGEEGNLRLLAALVGALVAWRSKNLLFTLISGMLTLWLLQWIAVTLL